MLVPSLKMLGLQDILDRALSYMIKVLSFSDAVSSLFYSDMVFEDNQATTANHVIDNALQTAAYAARTAIHSSMKISPDALVFQRDMLLDIPLIADLHLFQQKRQALIDERLFQANCSRISHDYQPQEEVLLLKYKPDKLEPRAEGPFVIERVHVNGTVTIRRNPYVTERINIRRIRPFRR